MRPRTLLILAGLVIGLVLFIFLYERKLPSTEERLQRAKRLLSFEADQVSTLVIEWEGKTTKLERPPKGTDKGTERPWKLVDPPLGLADQPAVDRLVSDLARLEFERELAEVDRKDAGLETPRGRIRWGGEVQGELRVGAELPAANQVLVEVEGRKGAFVVARWFATDMSKSPGDWRSREVVGATRDKISRLVFERAGGPRVVLAKAGERFRLEAPFADEADRDAMDRLLTDLTSLRISRFLDPPLPPEAEAGLASPVGRVEVSVEGGAEPIVIEVGAEVAGTSGERYHRASKQAFVGRSDLATALGKDLESWRSRSWSGLESFEVEKITLKDQHGELVLVREGSDWKVGDKTVPYSKAGDLLYAVTSARAEALRDLSKEEPVSSPTVTVTFVASGGREEVLTLHDRVGGRIRARRSGRAVELELPERTLEELERAAAAVREELKPKTEPKASEPTPTPQTKSGS